MKIQVPFTEKSVKSKLVGNELIISRHTWGSSNFEYISEVVLNEDNSAEGVHSWDIHDSSLRLFDRDGVILYEFSGVQSKNDVVYAIGIDMLQPGGHLMEMATLHEKKSLDVNNVCVYISTHVDYGKESKKLLKSLVKAGVAAEDVLVVEGGNRVEKVGDDEQDGIKVARVQGNVMGYTSFIEVERAKKDYILLLHDTCEVGRDFKEKLASIDIGLNPDVVLFARHGDSAEIGVYLSKFARDMREQIDGVKPSDVFSAVSSISRVMVTGADPAKVTGERDVYGNGVMRKVMSMGRTSLTKYKRRR